MKLISPSAQYKHSYINYIRELGDEERYPFPLDFAYYDFQVLLTQLEDFRLGKNLPEGFVASTTLWLVADAELVGVTNLRHYLNQQIEYCGGHIGIGIRPSYRSKGLGRLLMKLSIAQLLMMEVNKIHVHCFKNNIASTKVILKNGGVFDSEIIDKNKIIQRYIILVNN
ncbi:MAG: GNAT family N-acetyltransferase [Proteobacteria bacterium]|nr:GNAT family N-acetyltransferase [Pseudomonadota bacterium]